MNASPENSKLKDRRAVTLFLPVFIEINNFIRRSRGNRFIHLDPKAGSVGRSWSWPDVFLLWDAVDHPSLSPEE
jgi:hypothetical protein